MTLQPIPIKSLRWAFDIDGVVADTFPIFKAHFERRYKICLFEMPYYPDLHCCNVERNEFMQLFDHIITSHVIKPIPGAVETIKDYYYKNDKKPIVFITNRVGLDVYSLCWLDNHFSDIKFDLYSGRMNKSIIAASLGCTGIIDDKVKVCKYFLDEGLDAILHRQGHQRFEKWLQVRSLTGERLKRLSWKQIGEVIL